MRKNYMNFSASVFPGFYESLLYNSDTLCDYECGETPKGFCWDFVSGGFKNFAESTCREWLSALADNFAENPIGLKIGEYRSMWSPKEYNFHTDKICFSVVVNLNSLKKFCFRTERKAFDGYLRENWSSRSGFWSFIPNTAFDFEWQYKDRRDKRSDLQDIMIEFYLLHFVDFERVELQVMESDWERLGENVALCNERDNSLWDFEYTDDGCKPIKKIA